ncbi:MAG TPA: alpha/beta hydrolase-fold protein [Flavisolibacter sp.]|nr:alpha/beta hydrolase-fold protein [Flavisolibacter sp.]
MHRFRKAIICSLALFKFLIGSAQYRVHFVIDRFPAYTTTNNKIYLAGSFNNWNPHDERMVLTWEDGKPGITIDLVAGKIEYKFTRGSWETVESVNGGFPTPNRSAMIEKDTTIQVTVEHWADHFPRKAKQSTASRNVHVIDTAFFMPQLNRHRRIWIYLPEGYASSNKKYPVLYMHDGQNLFDEATGPFGEWGVDEALDTLGPHHKELIVVGIDNGAEKRLNEYSPYDMEKYGKGEGDQYVDFLVKTLKPFIDKHYRTKKDDDNTFIAGSSMGGLISFYAILKYPKVFGAAGVFSPAFWITPGLKNIDAKRAKKVKGRIYFYAGQQESESMVPDMLAVFEQMRHHSKAKMETVIRAEAKHNEPTWRAEFPLFYKWLTE